MVPDGELRLPPHIAFGRRLAPFTKYNLSDSCAEPFTIGELLSLAFGNEKNEGSEDLESLKLSYASLQGDPALRAEIAAFHNELNRHVLNHHDLNNGQLTRSPGAHGGYCQGEQVVTFCGAQEALRAVYQAVLKEGDEVIVITPCYPSLSAMGSWCGAVTKALLLNDGNGWQLDLEKLSALFTSNTRLVVINSPHNPTGAVLDAKTRRTLLELIRHHDCYLLADDVSQATNPFGLDLAHDFFSHGKTVIVSVMSKSFGLGGVRIGWTVTPDQNLQSKLLALKAAGSICTSAVDEKLALIALKARTHILARNNRLVASNIALFEQFLADHPGIFSWHPPGAGLLALVAVNCRNGIEDWCLSTAQKTGVGLMPARLFGLEGKFVRLGLGRRDFAAGLEQLAPLF